eukprot:6017915-Prymnesium_polylepis.1
MLRRAALTMQRGAEMRSFQAWQEAALWRRRLSAAFSLGAPRSAASCLLRWRANSGVAAANGARRRE